MSEECDPKEIKGSVLAVGPPGSVDTAKMALGRLPCAHTSPHWLFPRQSTGLAIIIESAQGVLEKLLSQAQRPLSAPHSSSPGGVWMPCWALSCERDPSTPSNSGPYRCHGDNTICSSQRGFSRVSSAGLSPLNGFPFYQGPRETGMGSSLVNATQLVIQ